MAGKLDGQVALVTGAGGSIGRAICRRFLLEGASVIGVDVDVTDLAETLNAASSGQVFEATVCDVARQDPVDSLVADIAGRYGKINILINNAGVTGTGFRFMDLSLAEWDRVMNVNLRGAFYLSQRVAREMLRVHSGTIVNVTSQLSVVAVPFDAHYLASKGGLLQLTRAMAVELGPSGIRVNALAPGIMETPMRGGAPHKAWIARQLASLPSSRLGLPDDLASAAAFLASSDSAYVYGTTLFADGGYTAL